MDIDEKKNQEILSKVQCVVCYSGDTYPELYIYKQTEKSNFIRKLKKRDNLTFRLEVPTCQDCRKKFHKWRWYNIWSNGVYVLGLATVILGIFFLIFHQVLGDRGIPLLGIGFLLIIFSLVLRFIIGKIRSNPNQYFFYDFSGNNFYIKPIGENDWILYSVLVKSFLKENRK